MCLQQGLIIDPSLYIEYACRHIRFRKAVRDRKGALLGSASAFVASSSPQYNRAVLEICERAMRIMQWGGAGMIGMCCASGGGGGGGDASRTWLRACQEEGVRPVAWVDA